MARFDYELVWSDNQEVDGSDETTVSENFLKISDKTNTFQSGVVNPDKGAGCNKTPIEVVVTESLSGGTSLRVEIWQSDDDTFSGEEKIAQSVDVPVATLQKGYVFNTPAELPEGTTGKFVRLKYVGVGNITAGKVSARVVTARDTRIS